MTTTPQTNATIAALAGVLREHDDIVICGHVSPDGDCLGSQLALFHALKALGKNVRCVLVRDEPVGADVAFLPGIGDMVPASAFEGPCNVFVGVDVPSRVRIGEATRLLDKAHTSITVDHHACDTAMCEHVYVDPDSASASMIVWQLVKELMPVPPYESALCAYTGLLTDTGGFRFQNADAAAFRAAAELAQCGIDTSAVAMHVFQNHSMASLRLQALVIDRMTLFADGKGALSWVTAQDMSRLNAQKPDLEPLVDVVRSLQGIRVACIVREQDGKIRGSFRSKDDTDVSQLARELGGGGHKAAAGFTLDMTLEEAKELVTRRLSELLA